MPPICDSTSSNSTACKSNPNHKTTGMGDSEKAASNSSNFHSCSICHINTARYKCPACSVVTCSCSCVKKHKLQTGCTGVREPVPVVQREDMDDEMLQRDYRFLESVLSRLEQSLRDPRVHHINDSNHPYKRNSEQQKKQREQEESLVFKHRFSQSHTNYEEEIKKKFKAVIPNYGGLRRRQVTFNRVDLPSGLKKLRYEARERNTQLVFMPRDMSRHTNNTSHYSKKSDSIRWRVRVEFVQANVYFEATFDENISIGRIVSKFLNCPLDELRGWSLGEKFADSSAPSSKATTKINCKSSHEDPYKEYWSETAACDTGAIPPSENKECQTNVLEASKDSPTPDKENATTNGSKTTPISFAKKDVINMTLNSVCSATDTSCNSSELPFAVDITRALKLNNPKPLNEAEADQMLAYQAVGISQLTVLFKNENFYDNRRYIEMCSRESLKECLAGLRVVEYPIFSVFMKDHAYELASVKEDYHEPLDETPLENRAEDKTLKYFDADCSDDCMGES